MLHTRVGLTSEEIQQTLRQSEGTVRLLSIGLRDKFQEELGNWEGRQESIEPHRFSPAGAMVPRFIRVWSVRRVLSFAVSRRTDYDHRD
ncbi:hypothetical protein AURDEDRAFT_178259 [Auricularia subglabra TFB-10046 SS5]|uniref:Uncharacterized protein n=1 Tax=Auricularia subglabra (strain TFB-10046 / SS5) TaxID=717982 RepID=J0WLJ5_AURST|nr:hypothetical protein AURDEDRAFT_178259 [Auricularia subglabra TFB-10046 SS5]